MLSEEVYQKAAVDFGTPVGVAKITGYRKKTEHIGELNPTAYKSLSDEMDINWIITESVLDGQYKGLQREIYNIRLNDTRIKKELSIYKKAHKRING